MAKGKRRSQATVAAEVLPETVSGTELGALLAYPPFTDRWIRQLADEGAVVKAGYGRYDLRASILAYVEHVKKSAVDALPAVGSSRDQYEAERARKLKMHNDERDALLMETNSGLAALDHIFGMVQTALAGVAPRVTEDIALRRKIEDAQTAVLSDLVTRFEQAGAALRAGRDPLEAGQADHA